MISLKCSICGGDIMKKGDVGVCESCGRKVPLADLGDDRLIENRNRANEARMRQDYSAAERAWSRIAADEPDSAEAHWNLLLSRYGIDYIWEDLTGEFYPTMNRVRWECFTDDPDYRAAVQYADENGLVYYMEEGKRLEELRERLLTLVKDEPGYDVFLCACDSAAADGDYAAEIHKELSAKGLRVFYGREALAGIPKTEQEPYIFSALYTSRVMVLFASAAEQLSDVSVKNEWSRFLSLMEQDGRKYLIPAYAHMRPEFFPDELPAREAVDLTVSGSMMDLVRGVLRFTGKDNASGSYAELLRIKQQMTEELKKKNFREVTRLGREGIEIAPDDADIWYYLFWGENQISSEAELSLKTINWMDSRSFTRAYELAMRQRRAILDRVKANWEAYQQRLLQDRQFAEDERAAKEKQAQIVSSAKTMMMREAYQEAYQMLTDNVTATDEIMALRDDAELGCEYEKLDRENYLTDALNREAPGVARRFRSMSAPLRKGCLITWNAKISFIGAVMMAFLYFCGFQNGTVEYGRFEAATHLCRIFGPIVFMLGVLSGTSGGLLEVLKVADHLVVPIIIVDVIHYIFLSFILEEVFSKSTESLYLMLMIGFLLLALVAIHDIPCQSKARWRRCTNYYSKLVAPLEKKYTEAYQKKYENLTSYASLGELTTIWDKYHIPGEDQLYERKSG